MSFSKGFLDRMLRIPWIDYEKFSELEVCVIGLGNTGSPTALMLHSLGLKKLVLIDRDIVEVSNLQRQFIYLEEHVEKPKVEAARDFLKRRFRLETEIEPVVSDARFIDRLESDFVFLCVDNHQTRKHVLEICLKQGIPLIDMGLEFYEAQAGYVLLVDRKRFPDGACINCFTDLNRRERFAGCIAAGVPYSGTLLASIAVGMFVHWLMKPKRKNFFFIDFNSMQCEFGFFRRKKNCEVCGNERCYRSSKPDRENNP